MLNAEWRMEKRTLSSSTFSIRHSAFKRLAPSPQPLAPALSPSCTLSPMLDLTLEKVTYGYGKDGFALKGVSHRFDRHRCTMLAGKGGCGKSTLLHLLSGALQPQSGLVFIGTREVNGVRESRRPLLYV